MARKRVLVLGCTGSIGKSALDIIKSNSNDFEVVGLTAFNNETELKNAMIFFNCDNSYLAKNGTDGLISFIKNTKADICINGISGSSGLLPSITVLECGMDLALANKETMVMAGHIIKDLAKKNNCSLLPVDSEHSAIFMLLEKYGKNNLDKIILTASGGPFRNFTAEQLKKVTVEDALKHPTWNMGKKITIDSSTIANKGLEVIEACMLFDVSVDDVQVVIHPQSIVHSLIRTIDGVMYAQMSKPDMRHPILTALTYPEFKNNNIEIFDFLAFDENGTTLTFFPPRINDFPMLSLAYEATKTGIGSQIAYNAANEVAVDSFIKKQIKFLDIPKVTEKVLQHSWNKKPNNIEEVFEINILARKLAFEYI